MTVMITMLVVIAQHSAVIALKQVVIDKCKVVANDSPAFVYPNLAAQLPIAAPIRDFVDFINDFSVHLVSAKPRASLGKRPSSPIVCRANCCFSGGQRSKASKPRLRAARTGNNGLANSRFSMSVNAIV